MIFQYIFAIAIQNKKTLNITDYFNKRANNVQKRRSKHDKNIYKIRQKTEA